MTTRVGFIGLGRMGKPMASNLVRKGFDVSVLDIAAAPVAELEALGATKAADIAALVADAEIIVTMLPNSAVVLASVLGVDGVLQHACAGQLLMDMSTIDPEATDRIAREAAAKGVEMVDAPVGRLASHADRGESLFMVGGTEQAVNRVRPLLDAMGTTVLHCGAVGAGGRMKLVNNYMVVTYCQMNAEALALAQSFGLDLQTTLDVLNGTSAYNGQLQLNWATKSLIGDTTPGFTIELAHKDLSLVLAAANAARVPMPIAAAAREMFSVARAGAYAGADFSAMGDSLCDIAGLPKPRLQTS